MNSETKNGLSGIIIIKMIIPDSSKWWYKLHQKAWLKIHTITVENPHPAEAIDFGVI